MNETIVIELGGWEELPDVAGVIIEKLGDTPRI
jgi:hypothetical protein